MSEPFIGEIRMFSFNWPPKDWANCDGQQIPISQNPTLFALLGTTYGGNGTTNFNLPDYRGRTPLHSGSGVYQGQAYGFESIALSPEEAGTHTHDVMVSGDTANANAPSATATMSETAPGIMLYGNPTNLTPMASSMVGSQGGSQPHNNMQPYLTVNFCIALDGLFPSRN